MDELLSDDMDDARIMGLAERRYLVEDLRCQSRRLRLAMRHIQHDSLATLATSKRLVSKSKVLMLLSAQDSQRN